MLVGRPWVRGPLGLVRGPLGLVRVPLGRSMMLPGIRRTGLKGRLGLALVRKVPSLARFRLALARPVSLAQHALWQPLCARKLSWRIR